MGTPPSLDGSGDESWQVGETPRPAAWKWAHWNTIYNLFNGLGIEK